MNDTSQAGAKAREHYLDALRRTNEEGIEKIAEGLGIGGNWYVMQGLQIVLRRHLIAAIKKEALG